MLRQYRKAREWADRGSSGVQRGLIRNTNFTRISDNFLILIQGKSFYCHNCRDETPADQRVGGSPAQRSVDVRARRGSLAVTKR